MIMIRLFIISSIILLLSVACCAAPYRGAPIPIPGLIEAEDYDTGGEGVAYHDLDAGNHGGAYRLLDGVDTQPSGDGGFNVGWTAAGEWLTYTIAVQQSGAYRVELRFAAPAPCPPVSVSINGLPLGDFQIASTGDWQKYVTQMLQVPQLGAGQATLRMSFGGANGVVGPNVNWIRLSLASTPIPPDPNTPTALDPAFYDQVFVGGLVAPTDVAFAPDGRIFISEKQGTIRIWKNGALLPAPVVNLIDEVHNAGDKGLLSITLHPFFTQSNWIYMLYAVDPVYGQPDEGDFAPVLHRLVRYTMNGDVVDPGSRFIILGNSPADGLVSCGNTHTGGKLRFAPDNSLMFTFGEGAHYEYMDLGNDAPCRNAGLIAAEQDEGALRAQHLTSLLGKVLRINADTGLGVPSNPWYDVNKPIQSRIWALGLRNPFRWSFKPTTDGSIVLYVSEVGNGDYEETNEVHAGDNMLWPCFEGRLPAPGYYAARTAMCADVTTLIGNPRWPLLVYSHLDAANSYPVGVNGNAATGSTVYSGTSYPAAYKGALFLTDHSRGWVRAAWLDDETHRLLSQVLFNGNAMSAVTIESSPATYNGDMFYLNLNAGQLRRIAYGNAPPEVFATALPTAGLVPITVRFSADGSADARNRPLSFFWDFGDGHNASEPNPWHTYTQTGQFTAALTLTAGDQSVTSSVTINTIAPMPRVRITQPAKNYRYTPGESVTFAADLSDNWGPVTLSWELQLVHNAHYHPQTAVSTQSNPSWALEGFTADGQRISYRVIASAINAQGFAQSAMLSVAPVNSPNQPPVAAFVISSTDGAAPLQVTCDSLGSADPDGDMLFFTWDWGDLSLTAEGNTARHTYAYGGTYTVTLTVSDNYGGSASVSNVVRITGPPPPLLTTAPPPPRPLGIDNVTYTVDVLTAPPVRRFNGNVGLTSALVLLSSLEPNDMPIMLYSGAIAIANGAVLNISLAKAPKDSQTIGIVTAPRIVGNFSTVNVDFPNPACCNITSVLQVLSDDDTVLSVVLHLGRTNTTREAAHSSNSEHLSGGAIAAIALAALAVLLLAVYASIICCMPSLRKRIVSWCTDCVNVCASCVL